MSATNGPRLSERERIRLSSEKFGDPIVCGNCGRPAMSYVDWCNDCLDDSIFVGVGRRIAYWYRREGPRRVVGWVIVGASVVVLWMLAAAIAQILGIPDAFVWIGGFAFGAFAFGPLTTKLGNAILPQNRRSDYVR